MKKARIVAREKITGIDTDEGLMALNGYYASKYHEFKDTKENDEICNTLSEMYKEKLNDFFNPQIIIEFEITEGT